MNFQNLSPCSIERAKKRCREWLELKFDIQANITSISIMEQTEIDKELNLLGIAFTFDTKEGINGDSVAFFDIQDIVLETISNDEVSEAKVKA